MSKIDPTIRVDEFDFDVPQELVAQTPLAARDSSRLMVVDRASGRLSDRTIQDLPALLSPGDLVVVNNTRVLAARLIGHRSTGARVELLLLRREGDLWEALGKPAARLRDGELIGIDRSAGVAEGDLWARIVDHRADGALGIVLSPNLESNLDSIGVTPLPPYIHERLENRERYQTVYSSVLGSAAAPTAGLHLTEELIARLKSEGVELAEVTLHVGLDTFRPLTVDRAADHVIHQEWCEVRQDVGSKVSEARERGGSVIAVGTTTARTLETLAARTAGKLELGWNGWTDLFITPGYTWQVVNGLLTNFHLPRSTLLMMVSSFAGRDLVLRSYRAAIERRYRLFSFGDAQLFL